MRLPEFQLHPEIAPVDSGPLIRSPDKSETPVINRYRIRGLGLGLKARNMFGVNQEAGLLDRHSEQVVPRST